MRLPTIIPEKAGVKHRVQLWLLLCHCQRFRGFRGARIWMREFHCLCISHIPLQKLEWVQSSSTHTWLTLMHGALTQPAAPWFYCSSLGIGLSPQLLKHSHWYLVWTNSFLDTDSSLLLESLTWSVSLHFTFLGMTAKTAPNFSKAFPCLWLKED